MDDKEPITEARLAEWVRRDKAFATPSWRAMHDAIAEIERLRAALDKEPTPAATALAMAAEIERLRTENATMREIVEAIGRKGEWLLVAGPNGIECGACHAWKLNTEYDGTQPFPHNLDCPVVKARALLDKHPA